MTTTLPPGDEVTRGGPARRRAEIACVTGIAVKTIFAVALLPLTPSLLGTDPVLLEALRGSTSAMASGGAFARGGVARARRPRSASDAALRHAVLLVGGAVVGSKGGGHAGRWAPERGEVGAALRRSPGTLQRARGSVGPIPPGALVGWGPDLVGAQKKEMSRVRCAVRPCVS